MVRNCCFLMFLIFSNCVHGDVILSWNTAGNLGFETLESSIANAGVAISNLTLGAGVNASANGDRFGGNNWFDLGDTVAGTTLSESIAGNDYIEFILSPNSNTSIRLTSFVFRWERSSTGPSSVAFRSSLDSFSSDLGQLTSLTVAQSNQTISLALSNITNSVTFRLYGFGATNTVGAGGFDTSASSTNPNVVLNGFVTAVPEPSSLALFGVVFVGAAFVRRRKQSV